PLQDLPFVAIPGNWDRFTRTRRVDQARLPDFLFSLGYSFSSSASSASPFDGLSLLKASAIFSRNASAIGFGIAGDSSVSVGSGSLSDGRDFPIKAFRCAISFAVLYHVLGYSHGQHP